MSVTINGTTGIAGVDGSAGTPALQGTDTNTGVFFGADTVTIATGGTAAVTVDSGQRTKFPTTIGVGGATPSTSGSGISFPATQSASSDANTLDDYEEGTWTPTYYGANSTGTTTYSSQSGSYVKVGSIVTIQMFLTLTAATGTGAIRIGGLPFSIGTVSGGSAPIMVDQYNWSAGTYLMAYLETGQSFLRVFACADDAAWSEQSVTNETQSWVISVSYRTT